MGLLDRLRGGRGRADGRSLAEPAAAVDAALDRGLASEDAGRLHEALAHYDEALRLDPASARAHFGRGNVLLELGDAQAAVRAYAAALARKPDSAAACFNLGNAHARLGHHDEAVASYRKALALRADFVDALVAMGAVLDDQGRRDEAIAAYREALALRPDYAEVHFNLGAALLAAHRPDDAVASLRQAVALRPDHADAHHSLGGGLRSLGRLDEALASYRRTVALAPRFAQAHCNLGAVLQESGQLTEAMACYRRAIELDPAVAEAHNNLGAALQQGGQFSAALASFRRALEINPGFAEAMSNLATLLTDLGQLGEAADLSRQALASAPDFFHAHSNLLLTLNYLPEQTPERLRTEAARFGEHAARRARPHTSWEVVPDPARRLRVGIVSADLRQHPVGSFLGGVLAALANVARDRVEFIAWSNSPLYDEVSAAIRACCQDWQSAVGVADESLARRIRDQRIDILIDLSGHTGHNRLPLFAWKPAPVQASWLGYNGTTGVAAIDYLLADAWTLPAALEGHFTERIWRLPESYLCFAPPAGATAVNALPAASRGYVTFGCFNNLSKINDAVVALWSRVLQAVPRSRLFLKAKQFSDGTIQQDMRRRFAGFGIEPERLLLSPHVARADWLAPHHEVDIALDPFPYPGITTTVESLWMGVPVLTLEGRSFISRQGVGLSMNAGLPDWIARDADDYVARAVRHAGELDALARLRAGLRDTVSRSPVFDATRFAGHFEAALRGMWTQWCADQGAGRAGRDPVGLG